MHRALTVGLSYIFKQGMFVHLYQILIRLPKRVVSIENSPTQSFALLRSHSSLDNSHPDHHASSFEGTCNKHSIERIEKELSDAHVSQFHVVRGTGRQTPTSLSHARSPSFLICTKKHYMPMQARIRETFLKKHTCMFKNILGKFQIKKSDLIHY